MNIKGLKVFLVLLLIIFYSLGCSNEPPHFKGYVLDVDHNQNRILVVNGLSKEELVHIQTVDNEILSRLEDAYWLRVQRSKTFLKGDYVEVRFRGDIATSFPAQAEAKRIVKIEESQE